MTKLIIVLGLALTALFSQWTIYEQRQQIRDLELSLAGCVSK